MKYKIGDGFLIPMKITAVYREGSEPYFLSGRVGAEWWSETALKGMQQWIPTVERLPEGEGNYLVTMVTPKYLKGRPYTNWLYWDADGQDWLTDEVGDSVPEQETEVVAWMSLPKPWQSNGQELIS